MLARKRLQRPASKDVLSSSGYSSIFTKQCKELLLSKNGGKHSKPTKEKTQEEGESPKLYKIASIEHAHTSVSVTSVDAEETSPQLFTSWIMANNITRLKTAYRYLTPIIDDIISRATSYTHKEFKEILRKKQPICSISYTQYIRAYQASEIITQVGKELGSLNPLTTPYQVDFCVNNMTDTIKREDLMENIERMADRIFIDRDLMKQLVNLHELITETIKKLKMSLERVSVEGLPPDVGDRISTKVDDTYKKDVVIDREAIRKDIAENFIVIGEPKNKGCHCNDGPPPEAPKLYSTGTIKHSIVMNVEDLDGHPLRGSKEKKPKKNSKTKGTRVNTSRTRLPKKSKEETMLPTLVPTNSPTEGTPNPSGEVSNIEDLINRSTEYTVSARDMELKCNEGGNRACAVHPNLEQVDNRYSEVEEALIVAESDSNEGEIPFKKSPRPNVTTIGVPNDSPIQSPRPSPILSPTPSPMITQLGDYNECAEACKSEHGMPCSEILGILRGMMANIADQLLYLKEHEIIDLEEKEFTECDYPGVDKEHYTMQEVMYCLKSLETAKEKLMEMNFAEYEAIYPDEEHGCCYRDYAHIHTKVIGIPIIVKISQTLLDLLQGGHGHKTNTPTPAASQYPRCACKPPTFKSLFKEKCALAKMLSTRNTAHDRNKTVMMTVDPCMDKMIFGMHADSLLVESAYSTREPDIFQVMDIGDSNTSLPYVVNRSSLPNITICAPMDIQIAELKRQVRNVEVEHPLPRIERELQDIGLENLLKASIPAKCCMPYALNRVDAEEEPYHASLTSLPLTSSDLQLIIDVAEEENFNDTLCNYPTPTATIQFKFELYTNFQERIFMPHSRVYLVYYFEIFKKDVEVAHHAADVVDSSRRRHMYRERPQTGYQRRTYERYPSPEPSTSHHTSRSIIGEFFRRLIFAVPNTPASRFDRRYNREASEREDPSPKRKYKQRKNEQRERTPKRSKKLREPIRERESRTHRRLRNQRLQACSADLERYFPKETTDENNENSEGIEDEIENAFEFNKIPSSLKNYTVSTMTTPQASLPMIKTKETGVSVEVQMDRDEEIQTTPSWRPSGLLGTPSSTSSTRLPFPRRPSRLVFSERLLASTTNIDVDIMPDLETSSSAKLKTCLRDQKLDPFKPTKEIPSSLHNLGTIYEKDEKDEKGSSKEPAVTSPSSSFYDFMRTTELSKSFQRFVESEQSADVFERNKIDPDKFWSMYFKARKEAHRAPAKSVSNSTIASETLHTEEVLIAMPFAAEQTLIEPEAEPEPKSPPTVPTKKLSRASKIPQRIRMAPSIGTGTETEPPNDGPMPSMMQFVQSNLTVIGQKHSQDAGQFGLAKEVGSLHSLNVLAAKNGPGYITILHPACGCPEVSIFIPCYCDEKGHKRAGKTSKHIARMSANTNGRHILLPASCRIPRLRYRPGGSGMMCNSIRKTSKIM